MIATTTSSIDRTAVLDWYRRNRERSARLFALIDDAAYEARPIPLRHPFVFYEGHLPAFSFLTLNERGLGETPLDPALEAMFERGIDPATYDDAARLARAAWPSREAVQRFGAACDERIEGALRHAKLLDPNVARLVRAQSVFTILEHEEMHHETLAYIIHQLDYAHKGRIAQSHHDRAIAENTMRNVETGIATLGTTPDQITFGWDNEFGMHEVHVPAFGIAQFPVTNGDWLAFVADGGPVPHFWRERDGDFVLRGVFEELPLPLSWPVYVTHQQAQAYAEWAGTRLPSEAEYHRAAFGTPSGDERPYPWGAQEPDALHGNFDFERFDPEPVDMHPAGASAWGVHDLIGNGWEWTSSVFAPFPGFAPMASYPQYSADFFDGRHYVMKGASPVTSRDLIRRSFRNWFYDDYPYMYAKFRCVTT
ncbi:MAG TPA: SUMF1/EgtB/PvdO family nonheme iron enzyme [Candidatus Baltobacteraceae bacterium]|jgi:formylglycine-generating enzyme required for sulfatase activity|nr:SUMF1/EgtB/PvdO family nonheme iron enzyme [Candidatus Baltobacteraceae bacterium]